MGHGDGIECVAVLKDGQGTLDDRFGLIEPRQALEHGALLDKPDSRFLVSACLMVNLIGLIDGLHGLFGLTVHQIKFACDAEPDGQAVGSLQLPLQVNGFFDKGNAGLRLLHGEIDGCQRIQVAADEFRVAKVAVHLVGDKQRFQGLVIVSQPELGVAHKSEHIALEFIGLAVCHHGVARHEAIFKRLLILPLVKRVFCHQIVCDGVHHVGRGRLVALVKRVGDAFSIQFLGDGVDSIDAVPVVGIDIDTV